ncbi:Plasma membrane ATPase 4 [Glycine soja]|uniref:Plasma membrane ATPase 4 n=1 Tax=Glycine soja TaxID=3848 RepID=A0A0B2RSR1_GLYSO|nr:Plasma membrane ATPase 4 [Glycine soja]
MYPSASLLGQHKDASIVALPVEELIKKADGFIGVFPRTIMTISMDMVKPSPMPDNWKLNEIFATGVVLGGYLALMVVIFFWAIKETTFFPEFVGVIWLYSIVLYFPLHLMKFTIHYILSGKAWNNLLESKTAFTTNKDYGKEERETQWAFSQRTMHGLQPPKTSTIFNEKRNYRELTEIVE